MKCCKKVQNLFSHFSKSFQKKNYDHTCDDAGMYDFMLLASDARSVAKSLGIIGASFVATTLGIMFT